MFRAAERPILLTVVLTLLLLPLLSAGCGQAKTPLRVIVAGSLLVPLEAIEEAFEDQHPDIDVCVEGHGSIQVIRQVTELGHEADVLMVADYSLIPMLMYNVSIPDSDESYADWYLTFARNSLGIAYTNTSKYSDEIDQSNWYDILSRPDVTVGVSDARLDSCGYRALTTCQLAELYYSDPTIFDELIGDAFTYPITVSEDDGMYTINVPEILQPAGREIALRGSSVWLLMLLDSGDVDYAFQYQSVAEQHGHQFLELPPEIDLGSSDYAESYQRVKVKLDFQRFLSVEPEFLGQPIVYGATIPQNAPHPDMAAEFVKFIISPQGQQILLGCNQPPVVPAETDNLDCLPDEIREVVE